MKDQNTSQLPEQAEQDASSQAQQTTSAPTQPITPSQHGRIVSTNSAQTSEDHEWQDEASISPRERRAMNFSGQSDASTASTPLKIRRRGMINDKKLTIDTTSTPSSSRPTSAKKVASESKTPASSASPSSNSPKRPPPVLRKASDRSVKHLAVSPSGNLKKNSPTDSLAPPPSAGVRWATPFTPSRPSPLVGNSRSPGSPTGSPTSGSPPTSSEGPSSGSSDKPLLPAPRYGFNPEFGLGQRKPDGSSPRSATKPSPTKPSPTYSGASHQGGVKSMLYSNSRVPGTPMSPRAPFASTSPHSFGASSMPRSPTTPLSPRAPGTPRTPRTPLTARLPHTPGLGPHSSSAMRGVLLTTVTRAASNERLPTNARLGSAQAAAASRTRNRSASIATEIRGFVRGGATEVIPRLELRVLERPRRQSQLYSLDPGQVQQPPNHRHSLAAAQPSILKEKVIDASEEKQDDSSPRAAAFARSLALDKLTSKRASVQDSVGPRGSIVRHNSGYGGLSFVRQRLERRQTGASVASGLSRRSDRSGLSARSAKSNRSGLTRRTSMPLTGAASLKSRRPSLGSRRMSLAPSSFRGRKDSSLKPDSDSSEDDEEDEQDDIVDEMQARVTNLQEAKQWILRHRPSHDANRPAAMGRDVHGDHHQRPFTSMRRPTYAASVFQQARLMEVERRAAAANNSSTGLDVNASGVDVHRPFTPFPQTPGFPKTPITALPGGKVEGEVEGEEACVDPETAAAAAAELPEPTWQQKTLHYVLAPVRFVQAQISPRYVLSMMDPREIIFPITVRKVALWLLYGGIIAMLVLLNKHYHWWHKLDHAVHGKNLYIMGILYGFEPLMITIIMLVAKVPNARVVPDRTVLVPRGRSSTDSFSDDEDQESTHSVSSDEESVSAQDLATQMHSTILEEEHDEEGQDGDREMQTQASGDVDKATQRNSRRLSGMHKPDLKRGSTHYTLASGHSGGERRGSGVTQNSGGLAVPQTPGFDPRTRRSTIILHEPLTIDSLNVDLARLDSRRPSDAGRVSDVRRPSDASYQQMRRPSDPSHQQVLARTASRESRRNSYFGVFAAAIGARPGGDVPTSLGADEISNEKDGKDVVATGSDSSGELDEKKGLDVVDAEKPDDVRIAMDSITHPSLTESTALIIPCHNADVEVLKAVLFAALVHFEPWQIFVVDNGNTPQPPTDMEASIRSQPMFERVNYIWLPVGNKNIAQFVGAKAAAVLNLDYVLTIDDDVIIPANFAAPMHIISETVTAVCYPITAVDHKGDRPLFVGWQDIEYKMSALAKMAESKMCGVLFPHGAASFWKRDTMIAVLRRHDLVYFADDVKMGLELQAIGERMGIDASISFETVAPETFLGPPTAGTPNYYNQRVRSWEMARHTLYWQFTKRFLFSLNGARTPVAIGWQKFTQFYNSTTNFIDWIRLPMFVLLGNNEQFWLKTFAFILFLPVVPLLLYRFIKVRNRPDLHPHLIDMCTYGIYKLLYSVVCVLGGLRSMMVFHPNHKHKPTLTELEKANDPRCIWLRDDFMLNTGGQGDLRDEPQQIMMDGDVAAAAVVQMEGEAQQEEDEAAEAEMVATLPSISVTPQVEDEPEVAVLTITRRATRSPADEQLATVHEARGSI